MKRPMPELVPRPDGGGALYRGGVPGNRGGGRPPKVRPEFAEVIESLERIESELATAKRRIRQLAQAAKRQRPEGAAP